MAKRQQLGFSSNSTIGEYIVNGLEVFNDKKPGSTELIAWCKTNKILGTRLAGVITNCYGDVSQSYYFWVDLLNIMPENPRLEINRLEWKIKEMQSKRGEALLKILTKVI